MKKYYVLFLFLFFIISCKGPGGTGIFGRKVKVSAKVDITVVPQLVIDAFYKKYAGVKAEDWYKLKNGKYAVRFKKGGSDAYAFFNSYGEFRVEQVDDPDYYDPYDDIDPWDWDPWDEY